jgi:hypothetical protein
MTFISPQYLLDANMAEREAAHLLGAFFCGTVWIGVRYLGAIELGLLTRVFVKGPLRQIIHLHSRLDELERSLSNARDLEHCWDAIQVNCRELGFSGGRLSVQGLVFEAAAPAGLMEPWQLRIPIGGDQYLNLYRDPGAEDCPAVIGRLAGILRDGLRARFGESRSSLTASAR